MFIHELRAALLPNIGGGLTDAQLLGRFVTQRDEDAFAALVRRHASMVWGVCRRNLHRQHDAEDAFQATFLVLVRKAASVVPREMVANWLYGVAHQTARKARSTLARRGLRERQVVAMPEPMATDQELWRDLQPLLDQELSRLPDKYRAAIVLCDLEGKTYKEAARQLGLPDGTLSGWLTRGRSMLAARLARRGLAVFAGASGMATLLAESAASAAVPTSVVTSTIQLATLTFAGKATAGLISGNVVALTEGVMKTMLIGKLKALTAALVVVTTMGIGAGKLLVTARAEALAAIKQTQTPRDKQQQQVEAELEAARVRAKQAEANVEQARAQLVLAEHGLAAAQARVASLENQNASSRERADRADAKGAPSVVAETLASRFKYRVPFEIGDNEQHEGGRLEILEVWGTRPKIEVGGQYLVHGKYVLPAGQRGAIYFYETADGPWGAAGIADTDLQKATLDKDHGEFTLMHTMAGPGYFHLHLSDVEKYSRIFADVYFGTGDNVLRKK
jgi:RNA polymerase sigma factor (sigma-70 family)